MDAWTFIEDNLAAGMPVLAMMVVESKGSSPGRQGFIMAVSKEGNFTGTIGGGIMEHKLVEKAKSLLAKGETEISLVWQYHDKKQSQQSGMICSGSQVIAFVPLAIHHLHIIKEVTEAVKNRELKSILLSPSGLNISTQNTTSSKHQFIFKNEKDWTYVEAIHHQPVALIFGGGHVGLALSQQLSVLGFYIKIYDNRAGLNTLEQNVFAHEKHIIEYSQLNNTIKILPTDFIIIVTVGYKTDKIILKQLLGKKYFYLGMMGSDTKIKTLLSALQQEGHSSEEWHDWFLPIGISIHSRTAAEIAVSIAAQMISEKNKNLPTGRTGH